MNLRKRVGAFFFGPGPAPLPPEVPTLSEDSFSVQYQNEQIYRDFIRMLIHKGVRLDAAIFMEHYGDVILHLTDLNVRTLPPPVQPARYTHTRTAAGYTFVTRE